MYVFRQQYSPSHIIRYNVLKVNNIISRAILSKQQKTVLSFHCVRTHTHTHINIIYIYTRIWLNILYSSITYGNTYIYHIPRIPTINIPILYSAFKHTYRCKIPCALPIYTVLWFSSIICYKFTFSTV